MIQSVDRAARILRALSVGSQRLGVSELSAELSLAKGTVHGLLRTLRHHGLVEQDNETEKYQLGPALLELSSSYLTLNELRARSMARSELLANTTGQAVRVGVPHGNGVLIVHHVFRPDATLQILEVGAVLPLHATALGKAVLAYLPEDLRESYVGGPLPRLTARTLISAAGVSADLQSVHERSYAVEREESILGEGGVAAPIFDRRGAVSGAIGVVGPAGMLRTKRRETALAGAVVDAARSISRELGATRWQPAS